MAKQRECRKDDPASFDKLCVFLKESHEPNELNEASPARDFRQWPSFGRCYARIFTSGSRQVTAAAQTFDTATAVIETPWTRSAAAVVSGNVLKFQRSPTDISYWTVLGAIDINEDHTLMRFVCAKADTQIQYT